MKNLLVYLSMLLIFFDSKMTIAQWMSPETDSLLKYIAAQTNLDTLNHYVNVLTGEDSVTINNTRFLITSRNVSFAGNNIAADYIYQVLMRTGLPTYNQYYTPVGRNVYSIQRGTDFPEKEFIICAHYDNMPASSIAPGADDNASGTAAVLEAARIISQMQIPYTIIYALWDEEEIGLVGSYQYASRAHIVNEQILGVVNLDMIAWDSNSDGVFNLYSSPVAKSFDLARLGSALAEYNSLKLSPLVLNNLDNKSSDHASFWNNDISAITIEEFNNDFNSYYHTSSDKIRNFNIDYFYNISELANTMMVYLGINGLTSRNLNSPIASLDKTYAQLETDSITFRIAFPTFDKEQKMTVNLLYSNISGLVTDSISMFDDGFHDDSLSGDGIYGGYIPPQKEEDIYIPAVSTTDQETGEYKCITQWIPFTTIGPLVLDSISITSGSPGNYIARLFIRNESASKTIEYSQMRLKCSEPWVESILPELRNVADIGPGGTTVQPFTIKVSDQIIHEYFSLKAEVFSYLF
ncbi:MAG: M28 family peptidase [Ignavibacteriaceae bacterium]